MEDANDDTVMADGDENGDNSSHSSGPLEPPVMLEEICLPGRVLSRLESRRKKDPDSVEGFGIRTLIARGVVTQDEEIEC